MLQPVWVVVLGLVALIGTVGNIFIIGAVCLSSHLRTRGNMFVVNLAIADLIITSYIMPIGLATSRLDKGLFSDVLCDINAFLLMTSGAVSIQSLMLVALERYFHICKITWYGRVFTPRLTGLYIALVWIYTMAWTSQGWTGWTQYQFIFSIYLCMFYAPHSLSYNLCMVFLCMVLPMIVLVFCYVNIFRTVRKSRHAMKIHKHGLLSPEYQKDTSMAATIQQQRKKLHKEQRLVLILFLIVVVFVLFWMPSAVLLVLSGLQIDMPLVVNTVCVWAGLSNSSVNSFLYGTLNQNFRRGYRNFLIKLFCIHRCCPESVQPVNTKSSLDSGCKVSRVRRQAKLSLMEAHNTQDNCAQEEICMTFNKVVPGEAVSETGNIQKDDCTTHGQTSYEDVAVQNSIGHKESTDDIENSRIAQISVDGGSKGKTKVSSHESRAHNFSDQESIESYQDNKTIVVKPLGQTTNSLEHKNHVQ